MGVWSGRVLPFPASYIWSFSIPQSMSFRRSLRRLAAVLAFGALINLLEGYGNDNPGAKSQG